MNFFKAGQKIVERLESLDIGLKKVEFIRTILDVKTSKQTTPAAYVVYQGHRVVDTAGRGKRSKMAQKYTIVVAVSNAASQTQVLEMLGDAGALIPDVVNSIAGWQPTEYHSPMLPTGMDKVWLDTAFSYYPFTFETTFTL